MSATNIVAVAALLLSGVSAFYTYRHSWRSLKVTTYRGATDLALQLDQVFIDFPDLRPFFYEGRSPDDARATEETLRHRVHAAAEFALDIFECIWDHRDTYAEHDRESWGAWISDMLQSSPVCSKLLNENRDWYPALAELGRGESTA